MTGSSIAEGIAVADAGKITRGYVRELVNNVMVVSEARIEESVALLLQVEKTLCEGAGAASLAAIMSDPERFAGRRVGLILCGGNIDNRLLTAILQRQQVSEGRLLRLRLVLPDTSATLGVMCTEIWELGGNINNVMHDRAYLSEDARSVRVEVELELIAPSRLEPIMAALQRHSWECEQV